jgi:hypothetical protein
MQVVYLDQNAASFLAKADPVPIWRDIREALAEGFGKRRLICPLPFESIIETAPRPLGLRQSIQSLFWELSGGMAFKGFHEMSNELTLALVRPIAGWSPWLIWKPEWAEMESIAQKVTADWKSRKLRMVERMSRFVPSPEVEQMTERELFHRVAQQRSLWIHEDLDSLLAGRIEDRFLNCSGLIQFLISESPSPAEVEALKVAILHHAWAKIPIHAFEILLGARWEFDSCRGGAAAYEPNDEIDRMRAAMALNHADLFITEGGIADLCRRAKTEQFSATRVLSVRNPEGILEAVRCTREGLSLDTAIENELLHRRVDAPRSTCKI